MLFLVGLVTVIGCVITGYVLHHGKLEILWQPTEVIIICGAAVGSFMIGNPPKVVLGCLKALKYLVKGSPYKKKDYVELLTMLYHCFKTMRSKGMLEMETHIENPHSSGLFNSYPKFAKNHHAVDFLCDYLRLLTMGMEDQYQVDDLMTADLETHHHEHHVIAGAWTTLGDAFPALGIVAAVLGVIVTMGSINEPPAILGGLIGAALVGTFLGILVAYGYIGPIGSLLAKYFDDDHVYLVVIKSGIMAHLKGNAPAVSVEFARNLIPPHERPDFKTVEEACSSVTV